jgi:integrase
VGKRRRRPVACQPGAMVKLSRRQPGAASITPIHEPSAALVDAVSAYVARYASPATRQSAGSTIRAMVRHTGARTLADFTEANLVAWITSPGSNNTVRQRISTARGFLQWCHRQHFIADDPTTELSYLNRQYPKTYGKVQHKQPARWLTHIEAFDVLVAQCQDGTVLGLRDELVIRLGLAGLRAAEIRNLRIRDIRSERIEWIGKGRRPRHVVPGARLVTVVNKLLAAWRDEAGPPNPDDYVLSPTVCRHSTTGHPRVSRMLWGERSGQRLVSQIVMSRAAGAGLGHVAPHDLRRSAAGILHHAMSDDGGHRFDLLDIQKVLGHADPATTMRSYLDPLDNVVHARAARILD